MRNLAVLLLISAFFIQPSFANTDYETKRFKQEVKTWSKSKRLGLYGANVFKLLTMCGGGALGTTFSFVADSLPLVSSINKGGFAQLLSDYEMMEAEGTVEGYGILVGGAISIPADYFSMLIDIADGELKDGDYKKPFTHVRSAYRSTYEVGKSLLGENSSCQETYDALGIIYNPNKGADEGADNKQRMVSQYDKSPYIQNKYKIKSLPTKAVKN